MNIIKIGLGFFGKCSSYWGNWYFSSWRIKYVLFLRFSIWIWKSWDHHQTKLVASSILPLLCKHDLGIWLLVPWWWSSGVIYKLRFPELHTEPQSPMFESPSWITGPIIQANGRLIWVYISPHSEPVSALSLLTPSWSPPQCCISQSMMYFWGGGLRIHKDHTKWVPNKTYISLLAAFSNKLSKKGSPV